MASRPSQETDVFVDLYEGLAPSLHRLATLLCGEEESRFVVRSSMLALGRKLNAIVDPAEQTEYLQEQVVHNARTVRGEGRLVLPRSDSTAEQRILDGIASLPVRQGELLVVSHYLGVFGPDLARIMRMTVHAANSKLERGLALLWQVVGGGGDVVAPGVVESFSQDVTDAVRGAARNVVAAPDPELVAELAALPDVRSGGLATWSAVLLVAVSLSLGAWLGVVTAPVHIVETDPIAAASSPGSPTTSVQPSPASTASRSLPAQVRSVPVYYVGRADGLLYRELRDLPAGGSLLDAALEGVLRLAPLDPDFDSAWGPGTLVATEQTGNTLTVDLTPEAYEGITTSQHARQAVDQMVYTAAEITGNPNIRLEFLSDGGAPPVILDQPSDGFGRRGLEPMPLAWITAPKNGAVVSEGAVVITGRVKPGANPPLVTITDGDDRQISSVTAQTSTTANSEGWRSWSVSVTLRPGDYLVTASTSDDSADPAIKAEETKAITVT